MGCSNGEKGVGWGNGKKNKTKVLFFLRDFIAQGAHAFFGGRGGGVRYTFSTAKRHLGRLSHQDTDESILASGV